MNKLSPIPQSKQLLEPFELAPYLAPFTRQMKSVGFTTLTIKGYADAVCHFGTWLNKNAISPCCITANIMKRFSRHRCLCSGIRRKNYLSKRYIRRVSRFVSYLRENNVVGDEPHCNIEPPRNWDREGFASWLSCVRGLVNITVKTISVHSTKYFQILVTTSSNTLPNRSAALSVNMPSTMGQPIPNG